MSAGAGAVRESAMGAMGTPAKRALAGKWRRCAALPATWRLAVFCIAAVLGGCQTVHTTQGGVVGVDRKQTMLVSAETVNREADKTYHATLADAQKKGQLDRDPQQLDRVRRIAARLIPATAAFRSDAPGWAWEV